MAKTIRIDTVRRRLESEHGITYRWQGGTIIRSRYIGSEGVTFEKPLHHSVETVEEAVADDAAKVLRGECIANRYTRRR